MGGVARAALVAAAVSNAGGHGMLGMVRMSPEFIGEQIRKTRALTRHPFGAHLIPTFAPVSGIGSQLEICLEERLPVISLFWCDAAPYVDRYHDAGTVLIQSASWVNRAHGELCGTSVGLIRGILPAAAIVEQMVAEAEDTTRGLPALLS